MCQCKTNLSNDPLTCTRGIIKSDFQTNSMLMMQPIKSDIPMTVCVPVDMFIYVYIYIVISNAFVSGASPTHNASPSQVERSCIPA